MYEVKVEVAMPSLAESLLDAMKLSVEQSRNIVAESQAIIHDTGVARYEEIIKQLTKLCDLYVQVLPYTKEPICAYYHLGDCYDVYHFVITTDTYGGVVAYYNGSACSGIHSKDFFDERNLNDLCKEGGLLNLWNGLGIVEQLENALIKLIKRVHTESVKRAEIAVKHRELALK